MPSVRKADSKQVDYFGLVTSVQCWNLILSCCPLRPGIRSQIWPVGGQISNGLAAYPNKRSPHPHLKNICRLSLTHFFVPRPAVRPDTMTCFTNQAEFCHLEFYKTFSGTTIDHLLLPLLPPPSFTAALSPYLFNVRTHNPPFRPSSSFYLFLYSLELPWRCRVVS